GDMLTRRDTHVASILPNGLVLVAGGQTDGFRISQAELYDPRSPGAPCTGNGDCTGGHCSDGVCCDAACAGQCQACDVVGKVGTCSAVTGVPHGSRPACTNAGTACGGTCDGMNIAT